MTRRISSARPGVTRSSASTSMIHSPRHAAAAAVRRSPSKGQAPSTTRAPNMRAISAERSVVRSSTTTISSAKRSVSRQAGSCFSSLRATTSADSISSARPTPLALASSTALAPTASRAILAQGGGRAALPCGRPRHCHARQFFLSSARGKERETRMQLAAVTLDDKYTLPSGRIYLSGVQALVRLPMLQHQRDQAAGLNTGGFISGYRGSPLGVYDNALWQARRFLQQHNIQFLPGINEDLAATAVWGSQQVNLFPQATVDGVLALWYGKGPGVDRSTDALKHANAAGTSPHGGVIAIAGDDHGCQSSTLAHQSEHIFEAAMIPILNPATVQEYLDFGLYGFALSRFSGCWVGFKAIAETVESSASVYADPHRVEIVLPPDFVMPPGGLNIRWPDPPLDAERRLHGPKMAAVAAFVRAHQIDRLEIRPRAARLRLITNRQAHLHLLQAFARLGLGGE